MGRLFLFCSESIGEVDVGREGRLRIYGLSTCTILAPGFCAIFYRILLDYMAAAWYPILARGARPLFRYRKFI